MKVLHRPGDIGKEEGRRLCTEAGLAPGEVLAIRKVGPVVLARLAICDADGRKQLNRRRTDVLSRLALRLARNNLQGGC